MARPKYPSDHQDQYMLRLPGGLRDRIKRFAERNGRSMNAEIVARLQGLVATDAEGYVRIWLPSDLLNRIEKQAISNQTTPDWMIRETLETAFPHAPTLRDYIAGLRLEVDAEGGEADEAARQFVEAAEVRLQENPELGDRTVRVPVRGYEDAPFE